MHCKIPWLARKSVIREEEKTAGNHIRRKGERKPESVALQMP